MKRGLVMGMAVVLTVLVVAWVISCGGGGSGGSSDFAGSSVTVNLGPTGQNIPLVADAMWSFSRSFRFDVNNFGGPFTSLALDLEENLPALIFSTVSAAGLAEVIPLDVETGTLTIYIAPVDSTDPCSEGEQYGPFAITLDGSSQPISVDSETETASTTTVDIINIGAFSICVEVMSPVSAVASQGEVEFGICDEPIADIAGTWLGDYSCGGNCPESGEIELWITQTAGTPGNANYNDDGGAFYMGNVCGYTFSFDGGTEFYDESGIFTMDPSEQTAIKTSFYSGAGCSGNCLDTLHRPVDE